MQVLYTALITPFTQNNEIDAALLKQLMHAQIAKGTNGLTLLGTTAETPTLSETEVLTVCETAIETLGHKKTRTTRLMLGATHNDTQKTVKQIMQLKRFQPDSFLIAAPYYNRPNFNGLIAHFEAVDAACDGTPWVLYDIPARTSFTLTLKHWQALIEKCPNLKGVKLATYDIAYTVEVCTRYSQQLNILAGNDDLILPLLSLGAKGIISAAANVIPTFFIDLIQKFNAGEHKEAQKLFAEHYELLQALYCETNPTGIKAALNLLNWNAGNTRLPLGPINEENKIKLKNLISKAPLQLLLSKN